MSEKGSSLAKSSSFGDTEKKVTASTPSSRQRQPPVPPDMSANTKEQPKPSDQAPSATLTLSSPVRERIPPTGGDRGCSDRKFLERCFFCQRSISNNRDVFMYSDMRAFCSAQCRQEQMNKEGFVHFVHPKRNFIDP